MTGPASARPDRLIAMANEISRFFAAQTGDGAGQAADHLRRFWAPQMRAELAAWRASGGDGLEPVAAEAVDRLGAGRAP